MIGYQHHTHAYRVDLLSWLPYFSSKICVDRLSSEPTRDDAEGLDMFSRLCWGCRKKMGIDEFFSAKRENGEGDEDKTKSEEVQHLGILRHGGWILANGGMVTRQLRRRINDDSDNSKYKYHFLALQYELHSLIESDRSDVHTFHVNVAINLRQKWSQNYFHAITEVLPRFVFTLQALVDQLIKREGEDKDNAPLLPSANILNTARQNNEKIYLLLGHLPEAVQELVFILFPSMLNKHFPEWRQHLVLDLPALSSKLEQEAKLGNNLDVPIIVDASSRREFPSVVWANTVYFSSYHPYYFPSEPPRESILEMRSEVLQAVSRVISSDKRLTSFFEDEKQQSLRQNDVEREYINILVATRAEQGQDRDLDTSTWNEIISQTERLAADNSSNNIIPRVKRIDAGTMSGIEQVAIFSQADILVGVHGANLANLIWMKRDLTAVIEILPPITPNGPRLTCYWHLANVCGIVHYTVQAQSNLHESVETSAVVEAIKEATFDILARRR